MNLHSNDKKIINQLQGGFPVCENPWMELEERLNIPAEEIIDRIKNLKQNGIISRFGPLYHAEKMGGGLTLAAMKVSAERFDEVAEFINRFPEVAHNYEREHELNMWFVVATESKKKIQIVLDEIQNKTGIDVLNMPKQQEFFLGLKLEV